MARLRLEIGPLSAEVAGADAKAAEAARMFAYATGAPRSATNQQLMEHTARELVEYMIRVGRQRFLADAAEAAEVAANNDVGFGVPNA